MKKLAISLIITVLVPFFATSCSKAAGGRTIAKWCENTPSCTCASPSCNERAGEWR